MVKIIKPLPPGPHPIGPLELKKNTIQNKAIKKQIATVNQTVKKTVTN